MNIGKRGLSGVVTTLLLILLGLVAVGVLWVVVANVLEDSSSQVNLDKFTVGLVIDEARYNGNNVDIKVSRQPGKGDVQKLKFAISNGVDTEVLEGVGIQELETHVYSLSYSGIVKSVSVLPILGEEEISGNAVVKEFSDKEMLENLGAIAWWRFEGNVNDEIGDNHGSVDVGSVSYIDGKIGNAIEFNGVSGRINIVNNEAIDVHDEISIVAWVNPDSDDTYGRIINKGFAQTGSWLLAKLNSGSGNRWTFALVNSLASQRHTRSTNDYSGNIGLWTHLAGTYNRTIRSLYVNGVLQSYASDNVYDFTEPLGNTYNAQIGWSDADSFDGKVDELILFNKALNQRQIQDLMDYFS